MAQTVERSVKVEASPERVLQVLSDFESYPSWQSAIVSTVVEERDDQNRPVAVTMDTTAMGMTVSALLDVTYGENVLEYGLREPGPLLSQQDIRYELSPDGADGTDLKLIMVLDVQLKLPSFVVKQLVTKGVNDNIRGAKKIAEGR